MPNQDRFTGAIIMDDLHKPDEAHSDTIRSGVIQNYRETILQRPRAPNVPMIFIGQRLHEDDICSYMLSGNDERVYKTVILQALDGAGNALYPEVNPKAQLLEKKDKNPYVFSSQYQQEPVPSGGALYKERDFAILDEEPEFLCTFLTCDTAETSKSYNDASVFSFWGLYKVADYGQDTEELALHWIDCWELRVEPKELEGSFKSFWAECMLHKTKPRIALIEKKSTGVTLLSVLQDMRGLELREVKRTKASGSKTARFLEMQPIIAAKLISFTRNAKHYDMCVKHMIKITASDAHKHDDICFVAGTKIATLFGCKRIEDITTLDFVITPFGLGRVTACGATGSHPVITRGALTGTPAHPIFCNGSFKPLDSVYDAVELNLLSLKGLIKWRYQNLLSLMETNIRSLARADITFIATKTLRGDTVASDYMWRCGNIIRARKYAKAMWFTIKMATILITALTTWSVFRTSNICRNIKVQRLFMASLRQTCNIYPRRKKKQKSGTLAQRALNGIEKMRLQRKLQDLNSVSQRALFVVKSLFTQSLGHQRQHVALIATRSSTGAISETLQPTVSFATSNSPQKSATPSQEIEKPALQSAEETTRPVYNLTVDTFGVYYANNILVSNCDTLYDSVKSALIDKTLFVRDEKTQAQKTASKLNAQVIKHRIDAIREARGY